MFRPNKIIESIYIDDYLWDTGTGIQHHWRATMSPSAD